jgi:hypothetical protein
MSLNTGACTEWNAAIRVDAARLGRAYERAVFGLGTRVGRDGRGRQRKRNGRGADDSSHDFNQC